MKLIQLCGAGRAGKSTIAQILYKLAEDNNFIPVILPFAQALKEEAASKGFTKDKDPEGYRTYCQKWGAGRRKEHEDYWVNKTKIEIERLRQVELKLKELDQDPFEHLVIQDDCRYMNELAFGRQYNAYQIFVTTGDRLIPELFGSWRDHESEELAFKVEIGDKDYTDLFNEYLVNHEPLPELQKNIEDKFFGWIAGETIETDVTKMYKGGLMANDQFLNLYALKDELSKVDDLLDMLEEIEDQMIDDTDSEFKEGAD